MYILIICLKSVCFFRICKSSNKIEVVFGLEVHSIIDNCQVAYCRNGTCMRTFCPHKLIHISNKSIQTTRYLVLCELFWHKSLHRVSITVQCCGEWFFGSGIACLGVIFGRSPASGRLCRLKLLYCRGPSDALSPGYIRLQTQSTATIRLVLLSANIWGVTKHITLNDLFTTIAVYLLNFSLSYIDVYQFENLRIVVWLETRIQNLIAK